MPFALCFLLPLLLLLVGGFPIFFLTFFLVWGWCWAPCGCRLLLWLQGLWPVRVVVMFARVLASLALVLAVGALGGFMLAIWSGDDRWAMSAVVAGMAAVVAFGFSLSEEL
jgi:hypothetical protein